MKRSQIALLAMGGVLAGIVIASVVSARIALSPDHSAILGGAQVRGSAELREFREIDVAGQWQVNVRQGDDWRIELSYPDSLEDRVKVGLTGERLWLRVDSHSWWEEPDFPVTADIVMPELEELDLKGASRVEIQGFRGPRLEIDIAGVTQLEGRESRYDELDLSVAGASHIDLRGVTVRDAELDLAGASKITLTMNGGKLSGSIAGGGSVEYYGRVSANRVQTAGFARVDHVQ